MVRIEDVAARAGVSTATVSRALRGLPNVSPATRAQVARAAAELDYVASRSAASLASGRTLSVAVVTPYVDRWYFAQVVGALEEGLHPAGYDVLLHTLLGSAREPFDPLRLRRRVDAVVVVTVPLTGAQLDVLRGLALPVVFVGAAVPGAASVRVDDVAIGRTATEHLVALGHTRVAHVGGDPAQPVNFHSPADRRAGWMSALRDAGLQPRREYDVDGDFTPRGGAAALRALLDLPEPPTAVFAASDEMALGVVIEAGQRGVQVPEELSVIGVDDHPLAEVQGLTTVAQDVAGQGREAARLVLEALRGAAGHPSEHVLVPVRLLARGSTCAPGSAEPRAS
ncbi:MAG: LacI family transcriptional regulator [Actinomycetota bacterium]|nr:LacI family transcriptional regulator [Actinomycetota bacterium]